jgi:hypothetical protein
MDKEELEFALKRLERRVDFRSEERVKSSLFFRFLFGILYELNHRNEDELEQELNTGQIGFAIYNSPYKIVLKATIEKIEE